MTKTVPSDMLRLLVRARLVSVPLVGISTADQRDTVEAVRAEWPKHPIVQWDAARGLTGVNKVGTDALAAAGVKSDDTLGFAEAMIAAALLPEKSVVLAHNAHRQIESQEPAQTATAVQAIANLRDQFKVNYRMLVLLAPQFTPPMELAHDIVTLRHDLPDATAIGQIVSELAASAKLDAPKGDALTKAVDAASGLSAFEAEQVISLAMTETGIDLHALWERKRVAIEQTPGLSVYRGAETFADIVGLDTIKAHLRNRLRARTPIGCIVFIDEIDKVLANVEQDTTGVRMDQLRTLLTEMENNEWRGLIAAGVAGGGKSMLAKAFGNEAGVPNVILDLGGMESKFVGESEGRLRHAMALIKAIGRGNAYVIATSNAATIMRPELQRRFTDGLWMFDLMTEIERRATWAFYVAKFGLSEQATPDDDGWTGAEIRNCVRYAWDTNCTLVEAARFVVPMARSRADEIERLRRYAHGRFLDASHPGPYVYHEAPMAKQVRAITLPPEIAKGMN
jgi:hypothetical protein